MFGSNEVYSHVVNINVTNKHMEHKSMLIILILASSQPNRVNSGWSNSCQSSSHLYINPFSLTVRSTKSIRLHKHKAKQTYTNIKYIFEEWVPLTLPLPRKKGKKAHKARTCWYRRPFRLIYRFQIKENRLKINGQKQTIFFNII